MGGCPPLHIRPPPGTYKSSTYAHARKRLESKPSAASPRKATGRLEMSARALRATKLSDLHQGRPVRDADWRRASDGHHGRVRAPARHESAQRRAHGSKHSLSSHLSRPMSLHPPPSRNTTGILRAQALLTETPLAGDPVPEEHGADLTRVRGM